MNLITIFADRINAKTTARRYAQEGLSNLSPSSGLRQGCIRFFLTSSQLTMNPKNPLSSKTLQGVFISLLGAVFAQFDIEVIDSDLQAMAQGLCIFGGAVFAVYGRYQATQPLKGIPINKGIPLLLACSLLAIMFQPGCNTLSEGTKTTLRETAKVASQVAVIQLLKGTKEAQPYLASLMQAVDLAFKKSDDPQEIGQHLAEALTVAVADYATRQLLLDLMIDDLQAPPADDGITAGPPGQRAFELDLAAGLERGKVHRF